MPKMARTPEQLQRPLPKVDAVDRKILNVLQTNSRASTREIARIVGGISMVAVSYRIKKLIRQGVIERFTAKIDGNILDKSYVIITRVICKDKGPHQRETAEKIARLPGVQSVYQVFGPYDIMVVARTKDKETARDLVYDIYRTGGIRTTNTLVAHTAVKESLDINLT